jgi:hypothetical protein
MPTGQESRINRGVAALNEDEFVHYIKLEVSVWLNLSPEALNEISLNDVEFDSNLPIKASCRNQRCAFNALGLQSCHTACIGFWVNPGRELIVYILSGSIPEAFVIPDHGWRLRQDITLH